MEGYLEEPLNCLICWDRLEEEKPLVNSERVHEFKELLRCFGGYGDGERRVVEGLEQFLEGDLTRCLSDGVAFKSPCCARCWEGLMEVKRLHEEIEVMKVLQQSHLEQLRKCLQLKVEEKSCSQDFWLRVRDHLSACIHPKNKKVARSPQELSEEQQVQSRPQSPASFSDCHDFCIEHDPLSPTSASFTINSDTIGFQNDSGKIKENVELDVKLFMRPCTVALKRLSPNLLPTNSESVPRSCAAFVNTNKQEQDTTQGAGAPSNKHGKTLAKKRKLSIINSKHNLKRKRLEANKPKPFGTKAKVEISAGLRRSCRQRALPTWKRLLDDNDSDCSEVDDQTKDSDEDFVPGANEEDLDECTETDYNMPRQVRGRPPKSVFYLVDDQTLLYKYTLIRVDKNGTSLQCLHETCDFGAIVNTDYSKLFSKMKVHLEDAHQLESPSAPAPVDCPLCPAKCPSLGARRTHLVSVHSTRKVICPVCWKPVGSRLQFDSHLWSHKNHEEKLGAVGGPPIEIVRNAIKAKMGKSRKLLERIGVLPTDLNVGKPSNVLLHQIPEGEFLYKVTDNLFLYNYSLLKVIPGKGIFCVGTGCSGANKQISGNTDYQSIQQAKLHVKTSHPGTHADTKRRTCPLCPKKAFLKGWYFRRHFRRKHPPCKVLCEKCLKTFDTVVKLKKHLWTHQKEELGYDANIKEEIAHEQDDTKKARCPKPACQKVCRPKPATPFPVEYFTKLQDNLFLYKFSLLRIVPEQGLICGESGCNKMVATTASADPSNLEAFHNHVMQCHFQGKEQDYAKMSRICPLCIQFEVQFPSGRSFRDHLLRTHGLFPLICRRCGLETRDKIAMTAHIKACLLNPQQLTDKKEKEKPSMEELFSVTPHVKYARQFECSVCQRGFATTHQLKAHSQRHVPKELREKFSCPHCPDLFLSQVSVRNHIERKHLPEGEKKLRHCPICNRAFYWRDGAKFSDHMRSHKNERPFVCDLCGMSFTARPTLVKHSKTHTEGKDFQCEFCSMSYKYRHGLRRHIQAQHKDLVPEEPIKSGLVRYEFTKDFIGPKIAFPCQFCDKIFELRSRRKKHLQKSHGWVDIAETS